MSCCSKINAFFSKIETDGGDHRPNFSIRYIMMIMSGTLAMGSILYSLSSGFRDLVPYQQILVTILTQHLLLATGLVLLSMIRRNRVYIKGCWFLLKSLHACAGIVGLSMIMSTLSVSVGFTGKWDDGTSAGVWMGLTGYAFMIVYLLTEIPPQAEQQVVPMV